MAVQPSAIVRRNLGDRKGPASACHGAGGLGAVSSIEPFGANKEFEQGAAQISQLQARCADNVHQRDRPDRDALSDADRGKSNKIEQYYWKQHKNSEPDAEGQSDTQHCYCDCFHFEALQQ